MNSFCNYCAKVLVILTLAVAVGTADGAYCTAYSSYVGCDEYIYGVQVGTINNIGTGCSNYANYTSSYSTVMEIGTGYTINVITAVGGEPYTGYEGDQCAIWVDWNQDEDFYDAGEAVYSAFDYGLFTTTITPPLGAVSGQTRMRIRLIFTGTDTMSPCGSTLYGEVEDYTIEIGGGGGGYCDASTYNTVNEYIARVQVGDIDNASGSSGYADYTAYSTDMQIGQGYAITVYNGYSYPSDVCGIWVDWNQDSDFTDAGETISVSGSPGLGPYTATITPPGSAVAGETRMRVRIVDSNYGALSPCGTASFGEVEDYTIEVGGSGGYCGVSTTYAFGEYISRVRVGDIDKASGLSDYSDYTAYSTQMQFGQSYGITVNNGNAYATDVCGIWVDWNQDEDFDDAGEAISVSGNPGLGPYTATITPPGSAAAGETRMRVRIVDSYYDPLPLSPCGNASYGEVEDYTIDVGGSSGYCDASAGECWGYMANVVVGDIANTSDCDNYADYTHLSTQMQIGTPYPITVTDGLSDSDNRCGIWVDWNQDMDFQDAGEQITVSGSSPTFSATITPPSGAAAGNTRMRIVIEWDLAPQPCGTMLWGEVEDYTINVAAAGIMVSGYVQTDALVPVEGVLISASTGESTTTNAAGYYEIDFPSPWSGTITPSKTDWSFDPSDRSYFDLSSDMSNQNYTATYTGIISILAIEDTYADSGDPCANYGSDTYFCSGNNGGSIYRVYLKFDLSSIPAGNVVTSATLRINNSFISIPAPELDVHRISDHWDESTVTWNDQPGGTGGLIVINRSLVSGDETTWDVTDDVDDDYADDGFYSVKIVSSDENLDRRACFASKDLGVPEWAPTLEIEYVPIFGGGTGEPDDPYQIWTGEQFNTIGLYPNRWRKHYKLMDDISMADFSGWDYNKIGRSDSIYYGVGPFLGEFDGNFLSVSDFSYFAQSSNESYIGLFGYVSSCTIKNLKLISPNIYTNYYSQTSVGPLAGVADGADIYGCSVIGGSVDGESAVGGLVGLAIASYIADCSSSANVSGNSYIGGLVAKGSMFGGFGNVTDCYAHGDVSGDDYVGGFIGDSSNAVIVNCYSAGSVSGTSHTGGFSGYNVVGFPIGDNVVGCFWDVESSQEPDSAVATGLTTTQMQDLNTFIDAGWDFAGETANGGSDDWAMPPGGGYPVLWHQLPVAPPLPTFAGGSGTAPDPYLIGTEAQLNSIGHNPRLMDKHFRLISDLDLKATKFYRISNRPYPFSGTFDGEDHVISNMLLEPSVGVVSGVGFIGFLEGTEAHVYDLTLADPNVVFPWGWGVGSLVGMNEGGTITNCHAVNADVVGMLEVGGLVGTNHMYAGISGCSATGDVSENTTMSILQSSVGGLAGTNGFWSNIENSFAKCNVSGDDFVGGLVGYNIIYSTLTNCYSQGNVTGTSINIGGLMGKTLSGTEVNHCYSSSVVTGPADTDAVGGFVGKMGTSGKEYYTACFWDSEINDALPGIGNGTDPDVTGKTTAQMQTENTFTSAGWDFLGETANGTEDIWAILEGIDYPEFVWQGPLAVSLDIDSAWMYQNLPSGTNAKLTATVSIADDPLENTGYTYDWEFILPDDVSIEPSITEGGTATNVFCTFAAPNCNEPDGLSDSGQALTIRVTVTGADFGNTSMAEAQFGIALLGDVNNDAVVNVADRSIVNAFWRLGAAGPFTFTDCNINCDTAVNVADRSIANAVWRGVLGQNSVTGPCPFR